MAWHVRSSGFNPCTEILIMVMMVAVMVVMIMVVKVVVMMMIINWSMKAGN